MEKIENEVQILKETVNSQLHDLKYAELSQQHDLKNAELEGDDGKHLKTQNKKLYTSAGSASTERTSAGGTSTKKEEGKMKYTNTNMNKLFSKPYSPQNTQKDIFVPPQINTYKANLDSKKQTYNHITRIYIENIYKIQTFLNLNPRVKDTKNPNENYITQYL